jgi:hypothetical protein
VIDSDSDSDDGNDHEIVEMNTKFNTKNNYSNTKNNESNTKDKQVNNEKFTENVFHSDSDSDIEIIDDKRSKIVGKKNDIKINTSSKKVHESRNYDDDDDDDDDILIDSDEENSQSQVYICVSMYVWVHV